MYHSSYFNHNAFFISDRHRAMGDVNAMVDIFFQGSLKDVLNQIKKISADTLWVTAA